MKKNLVVMLCLFVLGMQISAQRREISGQLRNSDGTPMKGVTIVIMDTTVTHNPSFVDTDSTVTDSLGRFSVSVPSSLFQFRLGTNLNSGWYFDGSKFIPQQTVSPPRDSWGMEATFTVQGNEDFSIRIINGGRDILTLHGGGSIIATTEDNKISILLKSLAGDPVSLYVFGKTSGDYKFPDPSTKRDPVNGDAMFQLLPSSAVAKNEFKSGYVLGTGGVIHLTVANGTCSGIFEATISPMNNGAISDVKYKTTGWFNNIPLKSKTR